MAEQLRPPASDQQDAASSQQIPAGQAQGNAKVRKDDKAHGERRSGVERRSSVVDRRSGLERRRGPGRRRPDSRRSAEEGELTAEQFEFVMAMDEYKRANKRPFPSWTEVLEVVKYLGYRKVAEVGQHVDRPAPDSK
ncbi:MAG TPA: hypothetical protein VMV94_04230 [Phycisphaerae bacterium]|nr:hypothetical protein [Phycisphaerae bacterium]